MGALLDQRGIQAKVEAKEKAKILAKAKGKVLKLLKPRLLAGSGLREAPGGIGALHRLRAETTLPSKRTDYRRWRSQCNLSSPR